jgi:16S rRNA (guanine(966)-N(2))-methyltransferase RsmD
MSIWQSRIPGARFLDLFAGSGAVGIEASSRGAGHVVFVEKDPLVLSALESNLQAIDVVESEVARGDLPGALQDLGKRFGNTFDLVFADPPYRFKAYAETILACEGLLVPGGQIAIEHDAGVDLPVRAGRLGQHDKRVYGDSAISFYSGSSD